MKFEEFDLFLYQCNKKKSLAWKLPKISDFLAVKKNPPVKKSSKVSVKTFDTPWKIRKKCAGKPFSIREKSWKKAKKSFHGHFWFSRKKKKNADLGLKDQYCELTYATMHATEIDARDSVLRLIACWARNQGEHGKLHMESSNTNQNIIFRHFDCRVPCNFVPNIISSSYPGFLCTLGVFWRLLEQRYVSTSKIQK